MDIVIFELLFLRKIISAPTINNRIDLYSSYMHTGLSGMDNYLFEEKRYVLQRLRTWTKIRLISRCINDVENSLFLPGRRDQNITDEQITVLLDMMNFLLVQFQSCEGEIRQNCQKGYMDTLIQLVVVALASNKKTPCEVWINEHLSELVSLRNNVGCSILHAALSINVGYFPVAPIVRVCVEEGKMDVNDGNIYRETPLHLLSYSARLQYRYRNRKPTEDMMRIAELLINNGAHMDAVDILGHEASSFFSKRFPQWSFNFTLKCLAARAILKHGIRYEKYAPKTIIPFIESHK